MEALTVLMTIGHVVYHGAVCRLGVQAISHYSRSQNAYGIEGSSTTTISFRGLSPYLVYLIIIEIH